VEWTTENGDNFTIDLAGAANESRELNASASLEVQGLNFDYAVNNTQVANVTREEGVTNSTGQNSTVLNATQTGGVAVYVVSGGTTDVLNISVKNTTSTTSNFQVSIDQTNSPVSEGETLKVNATLKNTGGQSGTQDVRLDIDSTQEDIEQGLTLASSEVVGVNLTWTTEDGDAGDYSARVASENDAASVQVTVNSKDTTGFTGASVSDISDAEDDATQTYTFTLGDRLSGEETVTINLANSGNGQKNIKYDAASATVSSGSASVTNSPELQYTAPEGGLSSNTRVSVTVSGIDPRAKSEGTYTVDFTRDSTGDSTTAEFTVIDDTGPGNSGGG
jgi:hypothetical protein